jgi:hypothetical protein
MTGSPCDLGQDSPELSRSARRSAGARRRRLLRGPGLTNPTITTSDRNGDVQNGQVIISAVLLVDEAERNGSGPEAAIQLAYFSRPAQKASW